jgi:hypothetical protein
VDSAESDVDVDLDTDSEIDGVRATVGELNSFSRGRVSVKSLSIGFLLRYRNHCCL